LELEGSCNNKELFLFIIFYHFPNLGFGGDTALTFLFVHFHISEEKWNLTDRQRNSGKSER
jgi:hypothetical protein